MKVTLDSKRLVTDKTGEVEWFPTRVCDILHEKGGYGHQSGICHACSEIYLAINIALGEVDD